MLFVYLCGINVGIKAGMLVKRKKFGVGGIMWTNKC